MEVIWQGENAKAFYKFDDIDKSRTLTKAFYPPDISNLVKDKKLVPPKKPGVKRILALDIATSRKTNADASAFFLGEATPTKNGYEISFPYAESMDGALIPVQAMRFNQLKHFFDVDYGIIDTNGSGQGVYDCLVLGMDDPEYNLHYEPLSCINDELEAEKCPYPNAPKIIYSMKASPKDNSDIAYLTNNLLRTNRIKLLMHHESNLEEYLSNIEGWSKLDGTDQAKFKVPFVQASMLVNEMVNLEAEYMDNKIVKLRQPRTGRKDKYSAFSYLIWMAEYLHQKNRQGSTTPDQARQMLRVRAPRRDRAHSRRGSMMF